MARPGYGFEWRRGALAASPSDRVPAVLLTLFPYVLAAAAVALQADLRQLETPVKVRPPVVLSLEQIASPEVPPKPVVPANDRRSVATPKVQAPFVSSRASDPSPAITGMRSPATVPAPPSRNDILNLVPPQKPVVAEPGAGNGDEMAAYRAMVSQRLAAHRPRGIGTAGRAMVEFRIDRAGLLLDRKIAGSSGSVLLDRIALKVVKDSSPFPPPPATIPTDALRFTLPVEFR